MWPAISNFATAVASVILCAAAVKLVDDYLDQELDRIVGRMNWSEFLGSSTMVYAMLLIVFAACINASISLPLFLSSYIVGMFIKLDHDFPTRLKGWQESFIVFGLGILFFEWSNMVFSLLFILSVQLFDDCLDFYSDRRAGYHNWAYRLGIMECFLLAGVAFSAAWWLGGDRFPPVFWGTTIFYIVLVRCQEAKICR
ncbi:hypothetical protein TcarDRAFT_2214 [Thermosinus carboxydivorans Nor1]|uniref:UbiA prenyltransferase n=1 Tax=Thermosinus carboxydivorans Nor1 TaxID=401526 RepID=A1HMU3_9FIRM|nr:hypothetical protein [Thermosinus carboxydivorans]EAX48742.1 hypothetical protein TcarDRAFT_2214 [Thermosinus carboxydivorans Nor1]